MNYLHSFHGICSESNQILEQNRDERKNQRKILIGIGKKGVGNDDSTSSFVKYFRLHSTNQTHYKSIEIRPIFIYKNNLVLIKYLKATSLHSYFHDEKKRYAKKRYKNNQVQGNEKHHFEMTWISRKDERNVYLDGKML